MILKAPQKSSQPQLAQVQIADQVLLIFMVTYSIDQHNSDEALRRLRCPRWGFQTSIHLWWPPLERKAAPLEERPCPAPCPFRRGDRHLALQMWIIVNNKQGCKILPDTGSPSSQIGHLVRWFMIIYRPPPKKKNPIAIRWITRE